jgi:hypothetical protein
MTDKPAPPAPSDPARTRAGTDIDAANAAAGGDDDDRALAAAATMARWMDGRYIDPLLGLLLPGVGDLLGSALGLYPVLLAWRRRAPKVLLARMLLNLAADAAGGSVPLIGDVWDFFFRAHARNYDLLRARATGAGGRVRGHWSDALVIGGAVIVLLAALALPAVVAVVLWRWAARTFR